MVPRKADHILVPCVRCVQALRVVHPYEAVLHGMAKQGGDEGLGSHVQRGNLAGGGRGVMEGSADRDSGYVCVWRGEGLRVRACVEG